MKKKPRASAKRSKRATPKRHRLSDAMRADDEKLRDELRSADLGKLDVIIGKAIHPAR